MKIRIHRGASEIGGSCVEVEASGQRILVDAGLPLNGPENVAPPIPKVDLTASLCAILISHPHLDHFGLVPWLPLSRWLWGQQEDASCVPQRRI